MNKLMNPLTVAIYAFLVGYGVTAIFSRFPVSENFIVNSSVAFIITILIVVGTAMAIRRMNRRHMEKDQEDNK